MFHLNVRVAWHDNQWNGSVCRNPALNSFCVDLDRIRKERLEHKELTLAGKWFGDILYAASDKTFFLELLETVCGAAITGTSLNV